MQGAMEAEHVTDIKQRFYFVILINTMKLIQFSFSAVSEG